MSRRISFGWSVLAAGFLLMIVGYAMRNSFTVFYPVIVADFGWARGTTAIMFSASLLCYGFVAPAAGGLVDRFDPRIILTLGGIIVGGGMALCSLATETWHFYLCYGVMLATGLSLIGMTPLSTIITDWFPQHRGMVFGLLGSGFGVSLVSAPAFQYLISRFGWQTAYVVIGSTAAAIVVPLALIFMKRQRESDGYAGSMHHNPAGRDERTQENWNVRKALGWYRRHRESDARRAEFDTRVAQLTPGERQVMQKMLSGKPNKAIAAELELGLRTVELRRANVLKKMKVHSLVELVRIHMLLQRRT